MRYVATMLVVFVSTFLGILTFEGASSIAKRVFGLLGQSNDVVGFIAGGAVTLGCLLVAYRSFQKGFRRCPHCASYILRAALRCEHCKKDVAQG